VTRPTVTSPDLPDGLGTDAVTVHIVGAGLIGTSIGLALAQRGCAVTLEDIDNRRQELADRTVSAVRKTVDRAPAVPGLVVIAVPPERTGAELIRCAGQYVNATVIDTASVMVEPLTEVETYSAKVGRGLTNVVLSHPLGGSASSGPDGAAATHFLGRAWALCRTSATGSEHADRAEWLVRACGAVPYWLAASRHDEVVALTSHVPQLVASALAANSGRVGPDAATLAGPALVEMTRVADSPAGLWTQIALANRSPLLDGLEHLLSRLGRLRDALAGGAPDRIAEEVIALLDDGRAGRALLAAKHAAAALPPERAAGPAAWTWIEIPVSDAPGRLAAVFTAAAAQGINIEDLRMEHASHAASGTVLVAVPTADADRLRAAVPAASVGVTGPA